MKTSERIEYFRSFEAKSLRSRSFLTQVSDRLTNFCGSTGFLIFHVLFFSGWIGINTGIIRVYKIFDPFPFGLLTMIVSLEAIFLSIFILVSQNRSSYVSTIRDEVHLGVNLIAEKEITKILKLLAEIRREMGITKADPELDKMLERIDTAYLERAITEQLKRADKPLVEQFLKDLTVAVPHPNNGHNNNEVKNEEKKEDVKNEAKSNS